LGKKKKKKATESLGHTYADMHMCMHALDLRMQASWMRTHTQACVHMLGFQKL